MASPKHHVYFVHGIGSHTDAWLDDPDLDTTLRQKIEDAWQVYKPAAGALSSHLDLVSVHYDDVYRALYERWSEEAGKLRAHLAGSPALAQVQPLLDALEAPGAGEAEGDFVFTHGLDLLWYWGNTLIQEKICTQVAEQIMTGVDAHYRKAGHSFSIVAHSMGTSVAHKVLQRLFTQPEYRDRMSAILQFRMLMQVSNTSYILSANRAGHYDTPVKPASGTRPGVCRYMVNVSNRLDLVSETVRFDPEEETWLGDRAPELAYTDLRTSRITHPNVHSIVHYFDNPRVQAAFFENVLDTELDGGRKASAWEAFEARTPDGLLKSMKQQFASRLESVKHEYREIAELDGDLAAIGAFIKAVKDYRDLIATFA